METNQTYNHLDFLQTNQNNFHPKWAVYLWNSTHKMDGKYL